MPRISEVKDYNGFANRAERLGLDALVSEVVAILGGFTLTVEERKEANGTQGLRKTIDAGFEQVGGWTKVAVGGVDWTKQSSSGGKIGVEVQVSGRSDMLAVDIMHLKDELSAGRLDVGMIVVPDDTLSRFLTDRTPNYRTAVKHVDHRASDLPIRILAFRHDATGQALVKMRTNLGRMRAAEPDSP